GLPRGARRGCLSGLALAAGARAARAGPDRLLRTAGGGSDGAQGGLPRRPPGRGPPAGRLRRDPGAVAAGGGRRALRARAGTGGSAVRGAARGIRAGAARVAGGTAALAAGVLRAVVPDQAAAGAASVPALGREPAREVGAGGGTAGAGGRFAAADERERDAAAQRALPAGRGAGARARRLGRRARRTRGAGAEAGVVEGTRIRHPEIRTSDGRFRGKGGAPALLQSVLSRRSGAPPFPLRSALLEACGFLWPACARGRGRLLPRRWGPGGTRVRRSSSGLRGSWPSGRARLR